jgi:hypothetical protein
MFIKAVLVILFFSSSGFSWTPRDQKLYSTRHFIELNHLLIMQNKTKLVGKIQAQEHDLAGCRQLNRGHGGIDSVILCIKFLKREEELNLFTPGRKKLISDINILCPSLLTQPGSLKKLIEAHIFNSKVDMWNQCNTSAWRQVYLTVYANFEADPVAALAFVHKAEANLAPNTFWSEKTHKIFN